MNGKGKNTTTHTSNSSYNHVSLPSNLFRVLPPSQSKPSWMPSKMTLFGLIECDIHVPNRLKDHFSELQPIFKNVSVVRQHVGPFMCEYAEKNKLLTQPCRTLVGSFFGEKIILATPLVKWYLEHGLGVDNVTLIIEYTPKQRFKQFGEQVSSAHRQGDLDSSQSILADTFKLLGSSAYGKV